MYRHFFNFRERPFQLVPNPAYLFLSRSHEEALAHLSYAVSQGDGFIQITGEVGTGKTTLCRAFLENLKEDTQAAYIFNPRLDERDLLKAINDELGIDASMSSTKDLLDGLNRFLMEKKAQGKKVILMVDEAQNLSQGVLEQLRLLSNLETSTSKLIQIILVGQPELSTLLGSYDLRQLGQRITLSSRLLPLTFQETCDYIRHRILTASTLPTATFSKNAMKRVFKHSRGIPRRINILCDRALVAAFVDGSTTITGHILKKVIRETETRTPERPPKRAAIPLALGTLLTLAGFCLAFLLPESPRLLEAMQEKKATLFQGEKVPLLPESSLLTGTSRADAAGRIMGLWNSRPAMREGLEHVTCDADYFRLVARQGGLSLYKATGDIHMIRAIDLPVILEMREEKQNKTAYLAVSGIRGQKAETLSAEGIRLTGIPTIEKGWTGVAYVPWKNFYAIANITPQESPRDSVTALKLLMQEVGFHDMDLKTGYDEWTMDNIRFFQKKKGIGVDGVVGSLTKILLYNASENPEIPRLSNTKAQGAAH